MKTLYAMITKHCNLDCPHCDIKSDREENFKENVFLENLKNFDGLKIVFGGEPTVVPERTIKALPYCDTISTNLLSLDEKILSLIVDKDFPVATSWNPKRFTASQLNRWQENVKRLRQSSVKSNITCLITLTPDLICAHGEQLLFEQVLSIAENFDNIVFEQLLDPGQEQGFYDMVDDWLLNLSIKISSDKKMSERFPQFSPEYKWYFDCTEVFTMLPDGKILPGCPQHDMVKVPKKCYTCDKAAACRPCRLQQCCTRPEKLMEYIRTKSKK